MVDLPLIILFFDFDVESVCFACLLVANLFLVGIDEGSMMD